MTQSADPITTADLNAYVDDQLDAPRRIDVEAYLSTRPDEAARLMADLRRRDELRLALATQEIAPRPATRDAARRLERSMSRVRLMRGFQRAAAVAVMIGIGWMANEVVGPSSISEVVASTPLPAYVEDAVRAHGNSVLRASMASQPEIADFDPVEIRAATAIIVPDLPQNWDVRDVQVYPSRFGPSVEMAIVSRDLGAISLFAVRPGDFDVIEPTLVTVSGVSSVYFQIGEVAYALVSSGDAHELDRAAERLARTLH